MILYIDKSQKFYQTLLYVIKKFSKIVGHKINIQNSVTFLYTKKKLYKNILKDSIYNRKKNT